MNELTDEQKKRRRLKREQINERGIKRANRRMNEWSTDKQTKMPMNKQIN